jgi:CRISPR-associated protein Csd1
MLELLVRRTSGSEPGFSEKMVRWAIMLDSHSGFNGVVELGQPEQKGNRGRLFPKCPDLTQPQLVSGSSLRSHFLVEAASVAALYHVDDSDTKSHQKHQFFLDMLHEAGKTIPQLATIASIMEKEEVLQRIQQTMLEKRVRPTDKVTFQLDGEFPLEQDYWHDWWRTFRQGLIANHGKSRQEAQMCCLATGELVTPAKTHPKIKGLAGVGGATSGDVLIGCDKEAFCSYGLEQSANAALSEEAASAYTESLNELIRHGERLGGAMVIHWFKEKVEHEDDPLPFLTQATEIDALNAQARARRLLDSLKNGQRPDLADNHYYIMVISGAGGRVMVRDWLEGDFTELVANINQWFDDLQIVSFAGPDYANSPKLEAIITCLLPPMKTRQYNDWVKPVTTARQELLQAAIKGIAFPYSILARLMPVHRAFILSEDWQRLLKRENDKNTALSYSILHCRMALIKAYHLRKYRKEGKTLAEKLTPKLNEDFPAIAYQCGRLLAALAQLQQAALGDVGAGVVQRFYAAASTTPALVLGRLVINSQHHLSKLDTGLAHWYEEEIARISSRIVEPPPKTFTLEEQSLFALGYYHQLAAYRTSKAKNNKEKEMSND